MKWLLIIYFTSGASFSREMTDRDQCEIARDFVVKRFDIAAILNPEHPTAVAAAVCIEKDEREKWVMR